MNQIKGINLGGWLVLEKWMTPSVFAGTDAKNEYELVQTDKGLEAVHHHHETFMTEADFKWLQKKGITRVRLPVGYWIFGDAAPYIGAIEKLDWAFLMAEKYQFEVLLDLHGAPGAQNAANHSGSGRPGIPNWLNSSEKQEQTIQILERLVERYNDQPAFWGIELINEPLADRFGLKLVRFYRRAYKRLTLVARPGLYIVFSDGFKPLLLTGALPNRKKHPVAIDCHLYQCFSNRDKKLSVKGHLRKANRQRLLIRFLSLFQPVVIGEWSRALPWTLTKTLTVEERRDAGQRFLQTQREAYSGASGQFYWSYKTEKPSGWSLKSMVE